MNAGRCIIIQRPRGAGQNRNHPVDINGRVGKTVQQKLFLCNMIAQTEKGVSAETVFLQHGVTGPFAK